MRRLSETFMNLSLVIAVFVTVGATPSALRAAEPADEIVWADTDSATLLSADDLSGDRGAGGNAVISNQSLAAATTGNALQVAGNLVNGNIVTGGDFGGSGFGSYVMNTGNNSTLTAATSVTIQIGSP